MALDEPIALRHGEIVSSEFKINLWESYFISITNQEEAESREQPCTASSVLKTEWMVTRDGRVAARLSDATSDQATISGGYLAGFDAEPGTYRLYLDEIGDPSCLNSTKPRLHIEAYGYPYGKYTDRPAWLGWIGATLGGSGVFLLLGSGATLPKRRRQTEALWEVPSTELARGWTPMGALRARRWAGFSTRPWERASNFHIPLATRNPGNAAPMMAMACCLCMTTLVFPTYLLHVAGQTPMGMMVRVMGPRTVVGSELAGETLSVWIDVRGQLYFNSKATTQEELPRLLHEGLARQASQVVYVDADDNSEFNVVARAIDIVRREHARVILITKQERGAAAQEEKAK